MESKKKILIVEDEKNFILVHVIYLLLVILAHPKDEQGIFLAIKIAITF